MLERWLLSLGTRSCMSSGLVLRSDRQDDVCSKCKLFVSGIVLHSLGHLRCLLHWWQDLVCCSWRVWARGPPSLAE